MQFLRIVLLSFLCLAKPALAETPLVTGSLGQQMTTNDPEAYLRYIGRPFFGIFSLFSACLWPPMGLAGSVQALR